MDNPTPSLRDPWLAFLLAFLVAGCLFVSWQILSLNGGHFTYTLDDPYIHLAVSEEIARGGYGINSGEYAAPSSSAIFPFLLAPFASTDFHEYWPLALNLGVLAWTAMLLWALFSDLGLCATRDLRAYSAGIILILIIGFNLMGLVFTGMEHSLHVLLTLAILLGVYRILQGTSPAWWLVLCIILVPLVRFEGAAIALAATATLLYLGHRRLALVAGGAVLATLVTFSVFLVTLGLPLLPSSVLIKSEIAGRLLGGGAIPGGGRSNPFLHPGGILILILLALMVGAGLLLGRRLGSTTRILLVFSGFVLSAHAIVGTYGWFERYEVYAVVFGIVSGVCLSAGLLRQAIESRGFLIPLCLTILVAFLAGMPYLRALYRVPLAASNIYEQQYQLHRLATDYYDGPVAVNDLGWVAFRNPEYVLDLFGLGSEAARRARLGGLSESEVRSLVENRGVQLVMIYGGWFTSAIPSEWIPLGRLRLGHQQITAAASTVDFYVTGPESRTLVLKSLRALARDLPAGVVLEFIEPAT